MALVKEKMMGVVVAMLTTAGTTRNDDLGEVAVKAWMMMAGSKTCPLDIFIKH